MSECSDTCDNVSQCRRFLSSYNQIPAVSTCWSLDCRPHMYVLLSVINPLNPRLPCISALRPWPPLTLIPVKLSYMHWPQNRSTGLWCYKRWSVYRPWGYISLSIWLDFRPTGFKGVNITSSSTRVGYVPPAGSHDNLIPNHSTCIITNPDPRATIRL